MRITARDIVIRRAGIFQRQPDELAATLNGRPIVQLIAHRIAFRLRRDASMARIASIVDGVLGATALRWLYHGG